MEQKVQPTPCGCAAAATTWNLAIRVSPRPGLNSLGHSNLKRGDPILKWALVIDRKITVAGG